MSETVLETFRNQHEADFAYSVPGTGRFRVNAYYQRSSTALAIRRVRATPATAEELGLPPVVTQLAQEMRGLVLVTGPTGSGKTTTLAAMIDHINHLRACHIVTIEDPVEVLHKDDLAAIDQREVGFDTDSFSSAMRVVLRQDPDVILVGEMRDQETVAAALSAAETGHLVFSTLHTINATETINRIVDFFPPHQQTQIRISLAGSLQGIVCQRLIPTVEGDGRVPALEVLVINGRIQQAIIDPMLTGDIDGDRGRRRLLRDGHVRPVAGRAPLHRPDHAGRGHGDGHQSARPQGHARTSGHPADRARSPPSWLSPRHVRNLLEPIAQGRTPSLPIVTI